MSHWFAQVMVLRNILFVIVKLGLGFLPVSCTPLLSFSFVSNFLSLFDLVVVGQDSAAAQQYSRQGCPTGLRADLWALILNSTNQPQVLYAYTHTNTQLSCTLVAAVSCQCLL